VWAYRTRNDTVAKAVNCYRHSGKNQDLIDSYYPTVVANADANTRHLILTYQNGDDCPSNSSLDLAMEIELICNENMTTT
jgi:hypothetical protein